MSWRQCASFHKWGSLFINGGKLRYIYTCDFAFRFAVFKLALAAKNALASNFALGCVFRGRFVEKIVKSQLKNAPLNRKCKRTISGVNCL